MLRAAFLITLVVLVETTVADDNPRQILLRPGLHEVRTLEQNWTDEESNWFYNAAQGSRLMPYAWLIHLEQPDSTESFLAAEHIWELGYIARGSSPDNPDALPIGFTKDAPYEDGTEGVGVTCAACHTGQISHQGIVYLVDGAPALGDMERLMKTLSESLEKTASHDAKFKRFASAVLAADDAEETRQSLRAGLRLIAGERSSYNERNFPKHDGHQFGHGRIDAFGAIFNEVSATFLGVAGNAKPADAPVSYPCLWDAPQHDRVQWNGAAENRTSPLGNPLFGTAEVGALGRNAGEVIGVFGHVEINDHELLIPRRYGSTVNKPNLLAIEATLKTLWSPQWPEALGAIDPTRRDRGKAIYHDNCVSCHQLIQRDSPNRTVDAQIWDVQTDPTLLQNFARTASTGKLQGRRKTLFGIERFSDEEPVGLILKHVVERVTLASLSPRQFRQILRSRPTGALELNPGFQNTAIIKVGDKHLRIAVDSLVESGESLRISARESDLLHLAHRLLPSGSARDGDGSADREALEAVSRRLESIFDIAPSTDSEAAPVAELANATASFGYKSRPLNGIWATAPYLHNGSVPTLNDLLKPAAERKKKFHVGSTEFDPVNVGFADDPAYPVLDTTLRGNSNAGHEHGTGLGPEEKRDLIEYLKSL